MKKQIKWFSVIICISCSNLSLAQTKPMVQIGGPDYINLNTVEFTLQINPNDAVTTYYCEWGLTMSYGQVTLSRIADLQYAVWFDKDTLKNLLPATTYHIRCVGKNTAGTSYSNDLSFTTNSTNPLTISSPATNITAFSAQLNGIVNPYALLTTYYFQWGTSTLYDSQTTESQIGSGNSNISVYAIIGNLIPNTLYHYQLVAQNAWGTSYGSDMTFTTGIAAPTVTTLPADNVFTIFALLNGQAKSNGGSTNGYFEYGKTIAYGLQTPTIGIAGYGDIGFESCSQPVTDLSIGTLYHYRLVAYNYVGTTYGNDMTFTTLSGTTAVEESEELPRLFGFVKNYPNPFIQSTKIEFSIPYSSLVTLKIYNALGNEVSTLMNEKIDSGIYSVEWDANGKPSGVYVAYLLAGSYNETIKLILNN